MKYSNEQRITYGRPTTDNGQYPARGGQRSKLTCKHDA